MSENPFRAALEWFGPNGERWCHDGPGDRDWEKDGALVTGCSVLVFEAVGVFSKDLRRRLDCVAADLFPDRAWVKDLTPSASVNDHPDTTFDDVRQVFEKAAIRWDEQEAFSGSDAE